MYFEDHEGFDVPMEERMMILPKPRQELFENLLANYKVFCPKLQLVYATLNFSSELRIDYLVIFKAEIQNRLIYFWDFPYAFTNRAIPAYRYAVKTNQHEAFFKECTHHMCQIDSSKFKEFIQSSQCGNLSVKPKDPNYWKNPENMEAVIKGFTDLGLRYKPSGYRPAHRPSEYF